METNDPRPRILGHEWCACGALVPTPMFQACGSKCWDCLQAAPETEAYRTILVAIDGARRAVHPPKPAKTKRSPAGAAAKKARRAAKGIDQARRRADHRALKRMADAYPDLYLLFRNEERAKDGQSLVQPPPATRFDEVVRTHLRASPYYAMLVDPREAADGAVQQEDRRGT